MRGLRQVLHPQTVVVMTPFAAVQDLFGNFLDRQVGVFVAPAEGGTQHQQRALWPHFVGELLELFVAQRGGGNVEEVALGGIAMLPVHRVGWCVAEAFQLAQRLGQNGGVVGRVDEHAFHLARKLRLQRLQRQQLIPEDQAVVEDVFPHPLPLSERARGCLNLA